MVFFTADTHFGHANIIRYCSRPVLRPGDLTEAGEWADMGIAEARAAEMDALLMEHWNAAVGPADDVYHLGDYSMGRAEHYAGRLNGRQHLVVGNHDMRYKYKTNHGPFASVQDTLLLQLPSGPPLYLAHYAHRVWPGMHRGACHLYGHSHGKLRPWGLSFDCGVDANAYRPLALHEVRARMDALGRPGGHCTGAREVVY